MLKSYTVDEYRNLYEGLSKKMQRLFWDDDISGRIEKISERFDLKNKEMKKLLQIIAHLFLGILPPSHIKKVVEVEIGINGDRNEMISNEITRLLVAPFYMLLKEIYEEDEFKKIGVKSFSEEENTNKTERNSFGDVYREPID